MNGFKKLFLLILAFVFIIIFRTNIIDRVVVQGDSMNPTYKDGDVMWARKYNLTNLKRNQVVVVKIDGELFIKRVIGLPNETIKIEDGYVYINGEQLSDDYGYRTTVYGNAFEDILVGENEYFLMGDNRNDSLDSREWGTVNADKIQSVVFLKFFPYFEVLMLDTRG